MTAPPDADPAPATSMAVAGSSRTRPPLVLLVAAAIVLTALVQGLVVQSYFVPTAALSPALEPGDRVLVWKVSPAADPGDVVVVDTTATAAIDRSTPVDDGLAGSVLSPLADLLGVDIGRQDRLAVVGGSSTDEVSLTAPVPGVVPREAVVGTTVLRVWPLDRLGAVSSASLVGAGAAAPAPARAGTSR